MSEIVTAEFFMAPSGTSLPLTTDTFLPEGLTRGMIFLIADNLSRFPEIYQKNFHLFSVDT
jgi:hypothetical protein